jgi:hypothetical protein
LGKTQLVEPVPKPHGFSTGYGVSKDLQLAKHPTSKEAVPKTEVLEQLQLKKTETACLSYVYLVLLVNDRSVTWSGMYD